jgi:ferrous iron transport protein A
MATVGEEHSIKKVGGQEETRKFLESLGFIPGSSVRVISKLGGNVIVSIRECRIGISKEMANRIMI